MTDKSVLTRNDLAALTILGKIIGRLQADKFDHDLRMTELMQTLSLLAMANGKTSPPFALPDWVPCLSDGEWLALEAWYKGEDVMLHVLSEPR